ncbi:hypothetical protein MPSEU_000848900 [Mayamaea pseudoterrestris]|nr:hypothetical protein MPSEU_000848900 [Mayamaea pseudoterrestris]
MLPVIEQPLLHRRQRALEDHNNRQHNNRDDRDRNNHNNNHNNHHYANNYNTYQYSYRRSYSRDPYYDADAGGRSYRYNNQRHNYANYYTHISDVFACLAMALGWAVWMLSSVVKSAESELRGKYQTESMIVLGHIRQVSIRDSELGIPVYSAVIDYMVPVMSPIMDTVDSLDNAQIWAAAINCPSLISECTNQYYSNSLAKPHRLHIRKQFESQLPLEEGFSNVELLVLPQEPTYSVIRDDYEKELQEEEQQQQFLDEEYCLWKASKCRKLSMALSGSLVLGSIAGAIHVVEHLEPMHQGYGWMVVCFGIPLLLPGAIFINWCLQAFQDALDFGSEKQGIIIDDKTAQGPYSPSCGNFSDSARETSDEADIRSEHIAETAGCYFIRMPHTRARMPRIPKGCGHNLFAQQALEGASNASESVSSISTNSLYDRSHTGVSV